MDHRIGRLRIAHQLHQPADAVEPAAGGGRGDVAFQVDVAREVLEGGVDVQGSGLG
ncbi:MAG TPA: hypothetical protein VEG38_12200 [Acidimicrobiia bacterium]|nr:hypothetical protein [Acidimicrobiia bacterium]